LNPVDPSGNIGVMARTDRTFTERYNWIVGIPVDLSLGDPAAFAFVARHVLLLGWKDERDKKTPRTGKAIMAALKLEGFVSGWRNCHTTALRQVYGAGRDHYRMAVFDDPEERGKLDDRVGWRGERA
jgi:hypothetical protein